MAKVNISVNDTIQSWVNDTNALANDIGDISQLTTLVDSDVVGAVNSLKTAVDSLNTSVSSLDSDLSNIDVTAQSRAALSSIDTGGDGSFSYNNTTGVLTYTGPSAAEVRAHLSAGGGLTYSAATGQFAHVDTSSVSNLSSSNSSNTFIQDVNFTFDSYGHVTGATVGTNTVTLGGLGITSTATELNYTDGVTSNIQSQLDLKALQSININTGAGLLGGGDLSADRTISPDIATQAEAEAGNLNDKLMTPLRTTQAIVNLLPTSTTAGPFSSTFPQYSYGGTRVMGTITDLVNPYIVFASATTCMTNPGTSTVRIDRSSNNGASWGSSVTVATITDTTSADGTICANGDISVNMVGFNAVRIVHTANITIYAAATASNAIMTVRAE